MNAEIIAIGTEIVLGQLVNTNSVHIADSLTQIGIDAYFQTNVDDDIDHICDAIMQALNRSDIVICCGGLGPTQDDVTKEALAKALNVPLQWDASLANIIRSKFEARHATMSENNLRQAYYPQGAKILSTFPGTAPGIECRIGKQMIFAMPGVPREMKAMLQDSVLPIIQAELHQITGKIFRIHTQTFKAWGLAESEIAQRLDGLDQTLKKLKNPSLSFLASGINGIKIRLTTKVTDEEDLAERNAAFIQTIYDQVGDYIYAASESETLESWVLQALKQRELTISIADGFSAGLVSNRLLNALQICAFSDNFQIFKGANILPLMTSLVPQEGMVLALQNLEEAQKNQAHFESKIALSVMALKREDKHIITYEVNLCVVDCFGNVTQKDVFLNQDLAQAREFCVIHLLMLLKKHLLTHF